MSASCHVAGRRGGVYVLVLLAIAISLVTVVGGLELVRAEHEEAEQVGDYAQAWQAAMVAMERGKYVLETEPTWRWTRGKGAWFNGVQAGGGATAKLVVADSDGSALENDAWKPFKMTATGEHGSARVILSANLGICDDTVCSIGGVVGAERPLAYWRLVDSEWKAELIADNQASEDSGGSLFKPGAIPGLGGNAAPWFSSGARLKMSKKDAYYANRTVSVWFWAPDTSTTQGIVCRDGPGFVPGHWSIGLYQDEVFATFESGSAMATLRSPATKGAWTHVVVVAESSRVVLYLNGAAVATQNMAGSEFWEYTDGDGDPRSGEDLYIGCSRATGSSMHPFEGAVCELLVLEEDLSSTQVRALYSRYPAPAEYEVIADSWMREVQ